MRGELHRALGLLRAAVTTAPSRLIRVCLHRPLLVFTDGAFELLAGMSIGGVLLDPARRRVQVFGARLSEEAASFLLQRSENPIAVVELLGVLCSFMAWSHVLEGQPMITFVDNEAAKHGLARGGSPVADSAAVIGAITDIEIEGRFAVYYERVASASNIADAPSRGQRCIEVPGWPAAEVLEPSWLARLSRRAPARPALQGDFMDRIVTAGQVRRMLVGMRATTLPNDAMLASVSPSS